MNDLDVFRSARPAISPLDSATAGQIRRAVFGAQPARSGASLRPHRWRIRVTVMVAASAVAAAAVAVAVVVTGGDTTRSISPATSAGATASPSTSEVITTAPSPIDDWRVHPRMRFQPPAEWNALFAQAREANTGRCMRAAGFEYGGDPYDTDTELADAAAGIQPGTYEAAFFGVGGQGGGCLDQAYATVFGPVRAEVFAEDVMSWASAEWRRTAFGDPDVLAALAELASCARGHGVEVRDVGAAASKALDDIYRGMSAQTDDDPRLAEVQATTPDHTYVHTIEEMRAVAVVVQNEWCPTFTAFTELFDASADAAAVAWIDANPATMAGIDDEFAEDVVRFRYIIDHDGELPA